MNHSYNITCKLTLAGTVVTLMTMLWAVAGCSDNVVDEYDGNLSNEPSSAIILRLSVGDETYMTRADSDNPMGGEEGNGLRAGEHHENDIENLILFSFENPEQLSLTDLAPNHPVKQIAYKGDVAFHPTSAASSPIGPVVTDVVMKFESSLIAKTDTYVAIANVGDIRNNESLKDDNGVVTWAKVRDYIISNPVRYSTVQGSHLSDCTLFTMANASQSKLIGGNGLADNPYIVTIEIERTTGRIDFMYDETLLAADNQAAGVPSGTPLLAYASYNPANTAQQNGWLYISHIEIANQMQEGSYLVKRLAPNSSEKIQVAVDEQHVGDEAVNYVVEPHTWAKSAATDKAWYGNTHITRYTDAQADLNALFVTPVHTPGVKTGDGFNTGWSFDKITFEKYWVMDYVRENTCTQEATSSDNTTSLLLKAVYVPKVVRRLDDGGNLIEADGTYGQTFWKMDQKGSKNRYYFASEEAIAKFKAENPDAQYADPIKYEQGICYYTIWIRHDNNGVNGSIGKMEYGIVRNNIYRIGVSSVLGPGSDRPTPDETIEDLRARIFVRRWNLINLPQINI